MKSYSVRVLTVIVVLSLLGNVLAYFRYSSSRPLVTIGSTVITKKQFSDQLEHDAGQSVLTKLVCSALVEQAAARAGVTPTDQDVEDRVQAIGRQAPQVLTPYGQDPQKMAQFRQDLTFTMALENLRIQDVALSPKQIAAYYARHQEQFALPPQTMMTTVVTQNVLDAGTAAEMLHHNEPPDVIARQQHLRVVGVGGYNPDLLALSEVVKQQTSDWAQTASVGDVRTFQTGSYSLTFRVNGKKAGGVPPLSQVRGEAERAARLELAPLPSEELTRLYRASNPTFNSDRYTAYFAAMQKPSASGREGNQTVAAQ